MWAASVPTDSAIATARACARGVRDRDLASRLLSIEVEIEANSVSLAHAAQTHTLASVTPATFLLSAVADAEVKSVYLNQLGKSGRPATKVRNRLIGAGPFGLCCYCQYGQATTLDHFVAKDYVPTLSIDPWNLVPSCPRCNHKLLAYSSDLPEEQFLHPYAMPPLGRWLFAEVVPGDPVSVAYYARPAGGLGPDLAARMLNEFDKLDLGTLFAIVSGPDIAEMNAQLVAQFDPGQPDVVRAHLVDAAASAFVGNANGRRGVLFEALAADAAYCGGTYATTAPIEIA